MAIPERTWLLLAANGVLLAVGLLAAAVVLRRREVGDGNRPQAWYDETVELAEAVRRAAEPAKVPADGDRVARRLLPLAGRIRRHVRSGPRAVDPAVRRDLFELATACQGVATERGRLDALRRGAFLEERLDALAEEATAVAEAARDRS